MTLLIVLMYLHEADRKLHEVAVLLPWLSLPICWCVWGVVHHARHAPERNRVRGIDRIGRRLEC